MNKKKELAYDQHYIKIKGVYPSVFALKMFLGKNPEFNLTNINFNNKNILDVGFGDGRDLSLFINLGFNVYGIEPSISVVEHTIKKFSKHSNKPKLSTGNNIRTNLKDDFFDFVYASGSIYYMPNQNNTIIDAYNEAYRITKKNGFFLGTLAKNDTHTIKNAREIKPNIFILKDEFYKQREGQIYHTYQNKTEIINHLNKAGFSNPLIFDYNVDWFGTKETLFIFVCQKLN